MSPAQCREARLLPTHQLPYALPCPAAVSPAGHHHGNEGPVRRWRAGLSIPSGSDLQRVRQEVAALLPSRSASCSPVDAKPVLLKMRHPAAVLPAGRGNWGRRVAPVARRPFLNSAAPTFAPVVGAPVIAELSQACTSYRQIVAELAKRGISTMRGGAGPRPLFATCCCVRTPDWLSRTTLPRAGERNFEGERHHWMID